MRFPSLVVLLLACAVAANHNDPGPVLPPVHEAIHEMETHLPWNHHHPRSLTTTNTTLAEPLIVSGEPPAVGEFPWIVKTASIYTTCTASLIHSDVVLTAAHCQGAWTDGVYVGAYQFDNKDSRSQFRRVERQYRHPQYDFDRQFIAADLMLLFLESPVDGITPVQVNSDPDLPTKAATVQVLGFGNTAQDGPRPNRLQTARLDYVSPDVCEFWISFFRNVDYDYSILWYVYVCSDVLYTFGLVVLFLLYLLCFLFLFLLQPCKGEQVSVISANKHSLFCTTVNAQPTRTIQLTTRTTVPEHPMDRRVLAMAIREVP